MNQLALQTLKSKYFIWLVIILTIIFSAISIYYTSISEKIIFPHLDSFKYESYNDDANGGNSQIVEYLVSDSVINLKFLLKDGFQSPYAGFSITPSAEEFINAEKYNQISLSIAGQNIDRIGFALFTPPISNIKHLTKDEAIYHSYLNISDKRKTYNIPLQQLKFPEWWEDIHQVSGTNFNTPNFDNILHINIGSSFSPNIEKDKTLKIYEVAFTRNNQKLYTNLAAAYFILITIIFGIHFFVTFSKNSGGEITVAYKAIDTTDVESNEDICIEYINNNYNNSELTLEKISNETAIPPRRITIIINSKFDCNFKTYLNRIRINESKRLLTQTDLNIGEIAYKVGFNNQSHFNRVFKSEFNISPSEYRENPLS